MGHCLGRNIKVRGQKKISEENLTMNVSKLFFQLSLGGILNLGYLDYFFLKTEYVFEK